MTTIGDFLAIGNNEQCPFCDKIQIEGQIDGVSPIEHIEDRHSKELDKLFPPKEKFHDSYPQSFD